MLEKGRLKINALQFDVYVKSTFVNIVSSVVLLLYDFIARGNCMTLRVTGKCFEFFIFLFLIGWIKKINKVP